MQMLQILQMLQIMQKWQMYANAANIANISNNANIAINVNTANTFEIIAHNVKLCNYCIPYLCAATFHLVCNPQMTCMLVSCKFDICNPLRMAFS